MHGARLNETKKTHGDCLELHGKQVRKLKFCIINKLIEFKWMQGIKKLVQNGCIMLVSTLVNSSMHTKAFYNTCNIAL